MTAVTSMPLSSRRIFYTNMMLLGFDALAFENQHKAPFDEDIFLNQRVTNQRALEQVIYFLLNRIDSKRCSETFRDCWPIPVQGDRQFEKEFRSRASEWLREVASAEQFFEPKLIASVLHSPAGDKLYDFLVQCSTYVLIELSKREYAATSQLNGKKDVLFCLRPAAVTKYTPNATRDLSERVVLSAIERNVADFLDYMKQAERTFSTFRTAFEEHVRTHERLFSQQKRAEMALSESSTGVIFREQVNKQLVSTDARTDQGAAQGIGEQVTSRKPWQQAAAPKPRGAAAMFDEALRACDGEAFTRAYEARRSTQFVNDCVASVQQAAECWRSAEEVVARAQRHSKAILEEFAGGNLCHSEQNEATNVHCSQAALSGKAPLSVRVDDSFRNAHDSLVRAAKRELRRMHAENVLVGESRVNLRGLVQLATASLTRHADGLSQLGIGSLPRCVADWRDQLSVWSRDFDNLHKRLRELSDGFTQTTMDIAESCDGVVSENNGASCRAQSGGVEDALDVELLPAEFRHSALVDYAPKLAAFQPVAASSHDSLAETQSDATEASTLFDLTEERAKLISSETLRNSPCKPRVAPVPTQLIDSPLSTTSTMTATPKRAAARQIFALTPDQCTFADKQALDDTQAEQQLEVHSRSDCRVSFAGQNESDVRSPNRSYFKPADQLDPDANSTRADVCRIQDEIASIVNTTRNSLANSHATEQPTISQSATDAGQSYGQSGEYASHSSEHAEESWVYEQSETSFALETDNTDDSVSA